jgi:caspase domain-containing protein
MWRYLAVRAMLRCAVLLVPLVSRDGAAQTRRALLIGINHYERFAPPGVQGGAQRGAAVAPSGRDLITESLDGAVNDAEAMRDLLRDRFNFDADHIRLLEDSAATREQIIGAIQQLVAEAQPGDVVVFYYAGHGSQRVNSGSKPTGYDQTIVPVDANTGVFDIRNKELARLFGPLVQKGVTLTLIFDSCHSGAITRGPQPRYHERWAALDPRDAADSLTPPALEEHGALVLSAAQDYETAAEIPRDNGDTLPHGLFTGALLSVLRSAAPGEPATRIYQQVKAMMQSSGQKQEPVLAGKGRVQQPLLGGGPGAALGVTTVAVLRPNGPGRVDLQGGLAVGLRVGAELVPFGHRKDSAAVRLKVTEVHGLSQSLAVVIRGSPDSIRFRPPELFEIDKWAPGPAAGLRVWMPAPGLDASTLAQLSAAFAELRTADNIELLEDPTDAPPDSIPLALLQRRDAGWALEIAGRAVATLPQPLTARAIRSALRQRAGKVRLFVLLPPSTQLASHLELGRGSRNDLVDVVTDRRAADYLLMGRLRNGHVQYAWVRPHASRDMADSSTLPIRSDWWTEELGGDSLVDAALRLAKVNSWLTMHGPPESGEYPYHLALRQLATGKLLTEGPVYEGEWYGLALRTDSAQLTPWLAPRWVYVFGIDSHGKSVLLFPASGAGNVFNRLPRQPSANSAEIPLGKDSLFYISPPFGMDTYVLLTSADPLPPEALEWEGVLREGGARGARSALEDLLLGNSAATRGPTPPVPTNWSIEQLSILSAPKPVNRSH